MIRGRRTPRSRREPPTVLLVCSPGGHLQQMLALEPAWRGCRPVWLTLRAPDTEFLLAGEQVVWAHGPTNRSLTKLARNLLVTWRALRLLDPDVILTTGAALAVPSVVLGRLSGRRTVYVESFTRTTSLSLSGRVVQPFATSFFVQWPTTSRGRRARYVGSIL